MDRLKKETLTYLIFGVLTTAVNYLVLAGWMYLFGNRSALYGNAVAFVVATAFAYITNKIFVFESKSWERKTLLREVGRFYAARLFSFGIEELGIAIGTYALHLDEKMVFGISGIFIVKIGLSVVAVILNYILSKWFIFKNSGQAVTDGGGEHEA